VALVLFSFSVFFIDWLGWEDCIIITEYLLKSINNKKKCGGCILLLFVTSDLQVQVSTHFSSTFWSLLHPYFSSSSSGHHGNEGIPVAASQMVPISSYQSRCGKLLTL
jgi:hypothetical protein